MKLYHYDGATGELIYTDDARPDPLDNPEGEEGKPFLVPSFATEVAPPPEVPETVRVFRDGAWGYVSVSAPEDPPVPVYVPTSGDVDRERDRRIALGFAWNGRAYQSRPFDLDNIRSMGSAATAKIVQGQDDSGYRWFDPSQDFVWIAADNTLTPMSASDMIDFALTAAIWVKNNIFAASAIKATAEGIPEDYAADARWPSAPVI